MASTILFLILAYFHFSGEVAVFSFTLQSSTHCDAFPVISVNICGGIKWFSFSKIGITPTILCCLYWLPTHVDFTVKYTSSYKVVTTISCKIKFFQCSAWASCKTDIRQQTAAFAHIGEETIEPTATQSL